jgi:hypothetical protein
MHEGWLHATEYGLMKVAVDWLEISEYEISNELIVSKPFCGMLNL